MTKQITFKFDDRGSMFINDSLMKVSLDVYDELMNNLKDNLKEDVELGYMTIGRELSVYTYGNKFKKDELEALAKCINEMIENVELEKHKQ